MTEPSRFVQPEVPEARVNRLWSNVSARLETRPARAWRWLALSTLVTGVAAGGVFILKDQVPAANGPTARAVLAEAKLETASDVLAVTLVDGSKVSLASRSEVQVRGNQPTAIALSLSRGEVVCDVTHLDDRKFTVTAGDVEVRVVGTKFSVKTTPGGNPRVEVSVLRGVVEVVSKRRPGIVARVAAGQSWIQSPEPIAGEPTPAEAAVPVSDAAPPIPRPVKDEVKGTAASASVAADAPSARDLFDKAGQSRRAGDAAAAARAYDDLLRLHPNDARASLSAFELGRLRMDRLGDPRGAITALERALALNVGPSFREDALARLVTVYASQGNFSACGRARDRYFASYPSGVHASAVATRCGTR